MLSTDVHTYKYIDTNFTIFYKGIPWSTPIEKSAILYISHPAYMLSANANIIHKYIIDASFTIFYKEMP